MIRLQAKQQPLQPGLFLAVIGVGAFLSHFTAGIVTVSLPELNRTFSSDVSLAQWIVTGYLLAIAIMLPVMGKLGDRWGHGRLHNIGYLLFTVSSVFVALSPNLAVLLVLRVIQALGASMFQATNIALITMLLAKEVRGRALGFVSMAVALGGMAGPVAGGIIAQWLNWRWLFLVHVPAAAVATYLAFRHIPSVPQDSKPKTPFDGPGALLFSAFTGTVLFGVAKAGAWRWDSVQMWAVCGIAIVSLLLFLFHSARHSAPFLPLRIFREPAVFSGLLVSLISFWLANAVQVVLPFYLTESVGISVAAVGALMAAYPIALALSGPTSGHLSDKFGARPFPVIGLSLMGGASLLFVFWLPALSPVSIALLLALAGIGMGLIAAPNNSAIMSGVAASDAGATGGLIALSRNAGMAFGAAFGLGTIGHSASSAVAQVSSANYITVFGTNAIISVLAIALLVYVNQTSRSKRKPTAARPQPEPVNRQV